MNILGISAFYHDASAVLLRNGFVITAAQEERFTRRKHDPAFPKRAIRHCLREGDITVDELDWVVFYEKPLRKFERILSTHIQHFPRSAKAFSRAMFLWLGDRLWMKNRIAAELGIDSKRILFVEHHQSHAASAFFPSPFAEAAVLTVDGVGEWATTTLGHGKGDRIELTKEIHFPHSLGLFYSVITAFLGFEVNEGEQKVMGLAAYGEPRFVSKLRSLIDLKDDGSFVLDTSAFAYSFDPERSFGETLVKLLGDPRKPSSPIDVKSREGGHYADIAMSLQVVLEEALLSLVNALHREVPSSNLCFAGGVALNVLANTRLLQEGPFDNLFVQPAPGDAGGALGAAQYIHHQFLGNPRCYVQDHAFLGETTRLSDEPLEGATVLPDEDAVVEETLKRLLDGKTVGWVHGRFEWGPRALGHRSLLADPRRVEMKDHINLVVKQRESFRPFAPAVIEERASDYFNLPDGGESPSRFMLLSVGATQRGIDEVPAALHVDNSARVQRVAVDTNPLFHRLLTEFGGRTGVPVLLNTSLNRRGEPIVRGEEDAVSMLHRSALDCVVVENRVYDSP